MGAHRALLPTNPVVTFGMMVGAALADFRRRAGVTQKDAARGAGISQSALSKTERGDSALTAERLSTLVAFVNYYSGPGSESYTSGEVLDLADGMSAVAYGAGVTVLMRGPAGLAPWVAARLLGREALAAMMERARGGEAATLTSAQVLGQKRGGRALGPVE
jgi:transcriptional regulator with XRE-family HTH domain